MEEFTEAYRYSLAQKKVERIKGFYIHLIVYFIANIVLNVAKITHNLRNGETFQDAFFDFGTIAIWLFWGIGILFHAFGVFGFDYLLGKNWERKKLKEYMDKDEQYFSQQ
ncbi:2TM domain-containing protein [Psychroserpens sp. S379A]|uniref:2TM domain-containing protein n=1 Tax=Psychroserpens sp. S379A TaxID=3415137 RepID=UPI003C7E704B